MLLVNAVNTEGRPLEIFVKDGRIAAVGQELEALAGENETVIDAGGLTVLPAFVDLQGKKKLFPAKGKAHSTKKGNNEPTAKPDANCLFSLVHIALFCMVPSPFISLESFHNILA